MVTAKVGKCGPCWTRSDYMSYIHVCVLVFFLGVGGGGGGGDF
jgi:hypothetical protein